MHWGEISFDEQPRQSIRQFAAIGFKLYQLDLFLEDCLPKPGALGITLARRQIRGVLEACPDAGVVLRWHLNAPARWKEQNPDELARYANGEAEVPDRKLPVRCMQDDLRRTPWASIASSAWLEFASKHTVELLWQLAKTPEGNALIGVYVANGVYGEWHYWGFMRNKPDVAKPMQEHFAAWRRKKGKAAVGVPSLEERKALDQGIFRDPVKREVVIDYYRCQQELVAERIEHFCALVKKSWPRPIVTGTFYGYFFSMFDRHATGGHLCLDRILASPHIDYLSVPQAYGPQYRDPGSCGITRALVESIRLNGKLFLDEMDQTPSWKWRNDVDQAFEPTNLPLDVALIRRNILEAFTRGAGHWYYDFGPANNSDWWADKRLMAEIDRLHKVLRVYDKRRYEPAGDVLAVFDTEVFFYMGSVQWTDPLTDPLAVNRTIATLYQAGAAIATVNLMDLEKVDLSRFKAVLFANTWKLTAAQRQWIQRKVMDGKRLVIFQGMPGRFDGSRFSTEFEDEVKQAKSVKFFAEPPVKWRKVLEGSGVHFYTQAGDVVHAGAGLVLIHTNKGGSRTIRLRGGKQVEISLAPIDSVPLDGETGERLV